MYDTLRKAVEAADGWRFNHFEAVKDWAYGPGVAPFDISKRLSDAVLDAIAGQLLRQLDAQTLDEREGDNWLEISSSGTVRPWKGGKECPLELSDERHTNIIKAIIDNDLLK